MNNLCQNCQRENLVFSLDIGKKETRYFCSSECSIEYCKIMNLNREDLGKVRIIRKLKQQEKKE
jgi:hypothetical protein